MGVVELLLRLIVNHLAEQIRYLCSEFVDVVQ